jgi:hypothetical protein
MSGFEVEDKGDLVLDDVFGLDKNESYSKYSKLLSDEIFKS